MDTGQTIDFNFGAVVASLGFKEKVEVPQVMARITELVNVENKLNEANQTIDSLKIEKAGEVTKNQNLTKELEKRKSGTTSLTRMPKKKANEAKRSSLWFKTQSTLARSRIPLSRIGSIWQRRISIWLKRR